MNRAIPFLLIVLSMFSANAFAQEAFDIATFQAPKGWAKQAAADAVQMSTEDKATGAFCLISVFKSVPGLATSKDNFDAAWQTIVKDALSPSSPPEMQPSVSKDGWEVLSGFAQFEKDGAKGAAVLVTASGHGRMVNILVITNSGTFEKTIATFLESVSLKKPAEEIRPQAPVTQNGSPPLAGNYWKQGGIRGGMLGHSGLATATFSKTYHFLPDGTYIFFVENMQLAAPKYYLEKEEGTYKVTGNTITITARKASFSQHRLTKEEPPIKSGNLPLVTAQSRLEFWNNDGNWALLLSPVDGTENKRDGTFSFWRNGEAQRTYQYVLVDANGRLIR
ncbi:MAG TPA: hypothetical protein VJV05_08220 [Pyrinomonadaceae bacterium]|nr:hypothetical protein [Pyrinomonadaceae bacterium]